MPDQKVNGGRRDADSSVVSMDRAIHGSPRYPYSDAASFSDPAMYVLRAQERRGRLVTRAITAMRYRSDSLKAQTMGKER